MNKCLLSIIIPVYNVKKYLSECLNSIINQNENLNYEIILVDDGSTDGSSLICDKFKEDYSSIIKVIHQNNFGVSSARNMGLKNAIGKFVWFIDSDDFISNDSFKIIKSKLNDDIDVMEFNNQYLFENGKIIQFDKKENSYLDNNIDVMELFFKKNINISLWNKVIKRKILIGISFDEKIKHFEDKLFLYFVLKRCNKYVFCDNTLYNIRKRNDSASSALFKSTYFDIIEVDNIIFNDATICYSKLHNEISKNILETYLYMIKLLVKSGEYVNYVKQYNEIISKIKNFDYNVYKMLNIKRKLELFLLKFNSKIYVIIFKNYDKKVN